MTRFFTYLLMLFVLFTHSTMAMDVHIPHDEADHSLELINTSIDDDMELFSVDSDKAHCVDAGGHCSHHQAHTAGLVSIHDFSDYKTSAILLSLIKHSAFIYSQAPPLRPPKV